MACDARYAQSWEFASFFCLSSTLKGVDDGGGAGLAFLTDTTMTFLDLGVQASIGMVLYNLTTGLNGNVTAATDTTITASGVTWSNGDSYRITLLSGLEIATIENYLDIAAGDLHAAMAASDQCACALASWADNFLKKLNIIDAASYYVCPCAQPAITDTQRQAWLDWMNTQLVSIRKGEIELCSGETGADYPAFGSIEQGLTEFNEAQIIYNRYARGIP